MYILWEFYGNFIQGNPIEIKHLLLLQSIFVIKFKIKSIYSAAYFHQELLLKHIKSFNECSIMRYHIIHTHIFMFKSL